MDAVVLMYKTKAIKRLETDVDVGGYSKSVHFLFFSAYGLSQAQDRHCLRKSCYCVFYFFETTMSKQKLNRDVTAL